MKSPFPALASRLLPLMACLAVMSSSLSTRALSQPCPTGGSIPGFRRVLGTGGFPRTVTYAWEAPAGAPAGTVYEVLTAQANDYCAAVGAYGVFAETTALSQTVTFFATDRVYVVSVRVKGCPGVVAPNVWVEDTYTGVPNPPVLNGSVSGTQVTLTLTQTDNHAALRVIERSTAGGPFARIDTRSFDSLCPVGSTRTFVDSSLAPGSYAYRAWTSNQGSGEQSLSPTITLTVGTVAPPTISSFTAEPPVIAPGRSATLAWSTSGATSVSIDSGFGSVPPSGSVVVSPTATTTYTLSATGPGGVATRTVTVTVTATPATGPAATLVTVAGAPGLFGAYYRTSVQLSNPTSAVASGRLVYHARDTVGTPDDPAVTYSLQPGETQGIADLLGLLGVTGSGSLDVVPQSGAAPVVRARVFNDDGAFGTTGVTEDALQPRDALEAGARGLLLAPSDPTQFRLSVGMRSLGDGATIRFTLRSAAGLSLISVSKVLPADSYQQLPGRDLFEGTQLSGNESVLVEVSAGAAFVYATVADNVTNDPALQMARRLE